MTYRRNRGLGKMRIPPLPVNMVLTDRSTGVRYLLSHAVDAGLDRFALNTEWNPRSGVREYAAGEEPWLAEEPTLRFIVRGGRVGYETRELPRGISDRDQQGIWTRRGYERRSFRVVVPEGWERTGDELAIVELDLT